ncbi:DapH/DapD/GlmU-related protein, partial [Nocardioides sp. P5_C9_2]
IGDRVFIGAAAVVNMGVTIGDEAVVAAGAVVTRDVAPRTIVAGVPARVVGHVVLHPGGEPDLVMDGRPGDGTAVPGR